MAKPPFLKMTPVKAVGASKLAKPPAPAMKATKLNATTKAVTTRMGEGCDPGMPNTLVGGKAGHHRY